MRKIVLFMPISLDGCAARLNGGMDWIKLDDHLFDCNGYALFKRITLQGGD
ncbi:MAG TPA: hypothetical protein VFC34_12475 [Puia sp.]|nr:hypothetical protein [Puia sp.]